MMQEIVHKGGIKMKKIKGNSIQVRDTLFRIKTSYERIAEDKINKVRYRGNVKVKLVEAQLNEKGYIEPVSGGITSFGNARCSMKDIWDRKFGRTIAIGRAVKNI